MPNATLSTPVYDASIIIGHGDKSHAGRSISQRPHSGLIAVGRIAGFHRISSDPVQLAHQLGLLGRQANGEDLVRAARLVGLKARLVSKMNLPRLRKAPTPAILSLYDGSFTIFGGTDAQGRFRLIEPQSQVLRLVDDDEVLAIWSGNVVLLARRMGAGVGPAPFGFSWFLPSLWRYRRPLGSVLTASLFVQLFALVTPLFFQVVVDKVLAHKSTATLTVVVIGLVGLGLFNVVLQYLRSYALSHTTNRIDVELGAKLFRHLMRLPLGYFETRAAGQIVARMYVSALINAGIMFFGAKALIAGQLSVGGSAARTRTPMACLQQYFPKGTHLGSHGTDDCRAVATTLNMKPRKTLGWKTPAEAPDEFLRSGRSAVSTTNKGLAAHLSRKLKAMVKYWSKVDSISIVKSEIYL